MNRILKCSVIESLNVNTPSNFLCDKLSEIVNDIWRNGLTEEHFLKLIEIFIQNDRLSLTQRKIILECLIPQFVVNDDVVEKILLWFFSMYIEDPQSSALLLTWIAALLQYKLMERSTLEMFYDQLATCFQSECLVKPLCSVLEFITNEKTVNKRTAFLVQQFYNDFNSLELKSLLWEIKKYRPHNVDVEFKSQPVKDKKTTDFEKAIIKMARKQGISFPTIDVKSEKLLPGTLPEPEYSEEKSYAYRKLTYLSSNVELGRTICDLSIALPKNPVSLIGSKVGLVYLELVGPNEEFLHGLKGILESCPSLLIVTKISELQNRLRHGLPMATHYLANFLITWDGIESQRLVWDLIKWTHFNTFSDLSSMILVPLTRLYICCEVEIKIGILHAIEGLLINMVSVHMERLHQEYNKLDNIVERPCWLEEPMDTFTKICSYVQSLIITGLKLEGLDSSSLILQAIKFYNTIITLQLEFSLICLIAPLPPVMYASLTSMNHLVLSEVGSLIIRYKKNVIPLLDSLGDIEKFSEDIDLINEVAENMFNYLWLGKEVPGKGGKTIVVHSDQLNECTEKVRRHPGVFPLIEFLAKKLRINPKKIKKNDLLLMLINYSEGLGEFIQYHMKEDTLNNLA